MNTLVKIFIAIKKVTNLRTYVLESAFVLFVLSVACIYFNGNWVEWISVFAVFFTFAHASVAIRMEESEGNRKSDGLGVNVECYRKTSYYFYAKEILWFSFFMINGNFPALVGVIIFLAYGFWRKTYRKHSK